MNIQEEKKVVRLKKPILACAVLLGAAMGLQATPVCPTTGSYQTLETLGSCTISVSPTDVVTFSGFMYSDNATNAVPVAASALTYLTIDSGPSDIGFQFFGVPLVASGPNSVNDIGLAYTVTGSDLNDAGVSMTGFGVGTGASAAVAETICFPSLANCSSSASLSVFKIVGGPSLTSDTTTFTGVGTLGVIKDIDAVAIGPGSMATLSAFSDTVSQGNPVPEPGFYGVLAGGIGAVLMFARRRKKTA
jgi:hypothetical protein